MVAAQTDIRDANKARDVKVAAARKVRDAKVKPAVDAAGKQANAQGKDPAVAKRDASKKARGKTKAEYDAAVKAANKQRDDAVAASNKKASATTVNTPAVRR